MEKRMVGRADAPAVLLLPDRNMSPEALLEALAPLEKSYRLLCPVFSQDEEEAARVQALSDWLEKDFYGRLWGAYGLREGGSTLLRLKSRGGLRIRTSVIEGVQELPETLPQALSGRLYFWYGSRDRKAKKACKALRRELPALRTLALRKLKAGQDFVSLRPDLMAKRLEKAFGTARIVSVSTVIHAGRSQLWQQLFDRPETGRISRRLRDSRPLQRDEDSYTQVVEGKTPILSHWSHLTRLESLGGGDTKATEQVEVSAGKLTGGAARFARFYLLRQQKQRARKLKKINR